MPITITTPSKRSLAIFLGGIVAGIALAIVGPKVPVPHVVIPHGPVRPDVPPAPPAPAPKPDWFGLQYPSNARALIASMPKLAQAAPHLMVRDSSDKRPILLYKAWTDVFKADPPYPPQQIGDCVSFGHGHGVDLLQCIEWVLAHPAGEAPGPNDIQETDTEFIYGASREIGGMLGPFDGSYGGAAVKAMTTVGMVSRRMMGDQGAYSGRRAKQFGRTGPPADWKARAAGFKLGSAAQVTTWDELVAALHAGHPVTICTGMGFSLKRDSQGFTPRQGRWGHCMFIAGIRYDREGACVIQSWGPDMPSGPTALDQPSFSFWVDRVNIESILAEGDSWALSNAPKFGAAAHARGHRRRLPDRWRTGGPAGATGTGAARPAA